MDGYKIGEISHIYGLSNDAIRYYERQGIITPKRDDESGYRYYDTWDVNFLVECLRYRSYGFNLKDVEQMIRFDDLQDIEQRCRARENELIKSISEQTVILRQLSKMRLSIASIKSRVGEFVHEDSPEIVWQRQQDNQNNEKGKLEQGLGAEAIRDWIKHMPFLGHTFVMPPLKSAQEFNEYCWGFSLSPKDLSQLNIDIPETAQYIPSYPSIHTVFVAGEEGSFLPSIHEQVIDPIKKMKYKITNPPMGNLLVRIHEDGKMKRYVEVWVPVK